MNRPDDELDNLFRNHFAAELDPMRGQAARAFDREIVRPMRRRLRLHAVRGLIGRARHYAPMAMSMAACCALGFFVPHWLSSPAEQAAVANAQPIDTAPAQAASSQTAAAQRPEAAPPLWQSQIESARFVDPANHSRTEYIIIHNDPELPPGAARQ